MSDCTKQVQGPVRTAEAIPLLAHKVLEHGKVAYCPHSSTVA